MACSCSDNLACGAGSICGTIVANSAGSSTVVFTFPASWTTSQVNALITINNGTTANNVNVTATTGTVTGTPALPVTPGGTSVVTIENGTGSITIVLTAGAGSTGSVCWQLAFAATIPCPT